MPTLIECLPYLYIGVNINFSTPLNYINPATTTGVSQTSVIFRQIKVLNATLYYILILYISWRPPLVSVRTHEPFFSQILLAYQHIVVVVTISTYNYSNRYGGSHDGCNKLADGRAIDQLHRRQADVVLPHIRIHVQVDRWVCSAGRVLWRQIRLSRQIGRTSVLHRYVYIYRDHTIVIFHLGTR